jgi:hypothetical protein
MHHKTAASKIGQPDRTQRYRERQRAKAEDEGTL